MSGLSLAVFLNNLSGNTSTLGHIVPIFLRPRANLRVLEALSGVARIAAATGRTRLTASLDVRLNCFGKFLEMSAVQVNFIGKRTVWSAGVPSKSSTTSTIFFVFFTMSFLSGK